MTSSVVQNEMIMDENMYQSNMQNHDRSNITSSSNNNHDLNHGDDTVIGQSQQQQQQPQLELENQQQQQQQQQGIEDGAYVPFSDLEDEDNSYDFQNNNNNNNDSTGDSSKNISEDGIDNGIKNKKSWWICCYQSNFWNNCLNESNRTLIIQACYISIAAIAGSLLRIVLAQLFGEACANPGTIGWLNAASPLCVTKDGQTKLQNGIVFADLPSNILGSFLMGLLQDYTILGLAVPMAVAWLPPTHSFQRCIIIHTALKTGFCGSLTTFSSWNSEMVIMMFGTASTKSTHVISSILGYIIGMETSLGSYTCGCSLARRLHRTINPIIAAEGDAMQKKQLEGIYINHNLPDYERKYLHQLDMNHYKNPMEYTILDDNVQYLHSWRTSTEHIRRVNNPLVPILVEIETTILNEKCISYIPKKLSKHFEDVARNEQWKIDDLYEWQIKKLSSTTNNSSSPRLLMTDQQRALSFSDNTDYKQFLYGNLDTIGLWDGYRQQLKFSKWLKLPLAITVLGIIVSLLLVAVITLRDNTATTVTNRTMAYAMLFAPIGALLRWHLSRYNNNIKFAQYYGHESMTWFPYGTFFANFIGSIVSIICIAIEYNCTKNGYYYDNDSYYDHTAPFIVIGSLRAIRIGFSGCLTTVSTFVAETHNFMRTKTDHAYPYIFITLCTCSAVCIVIYGFIIYNFE